MSTTQHERRPSIGSWWARQGRIPNRRSLWISALVAGLVMVTVPRLFGDYADTVTCFLFFGIYGVGLFWLKRLRPGRLTVGWRILAIATPILIAITGTFSTMSTLVSIGDPVLAALFVASVPVAIIAFLVLSVATWLVRKLTRSRSAATPADTAPPLRSTPIAMTAESEPLDPQRQRLFDLLNNPGALGRCFFDGRLAQNLGPVTSAPRSRAKYTKADLAMAAWRSGKSIYSTVVKKPGFFVVDGQRYRVPRLLEIQTSRAGVTAWFDILPGTTIDKYRQAAGIMEVALGLPLGIDVEQTEDDIWNRRMRFKLRVVDPLKDIVPYSADPTTEITPDTPWVIGPDEDGTIIDYDFAANAHLLIAGATRSGKSVLTYSMLTHLLRMGDSVRVLAADPNDTTIAPFESKLSWATSEEHPEEPTEMLRWVREHVMKARKPILRAMRRDKLDVFTAENPMYVIVIDEAANYMKHADSSAAGAFITELMAVVAQGAKFGVRLVLITQRPDSTILPPSVRSQLSARISFRLEDKQTPAMAFPDIDDPGQLLRFPKGVGLYKEVAGQPRKFRAEFLEDHWAAADLIAHALPKIDIYNADSISNDIDEEKLENPFAV